VVVPSVKVVDEMDVVAARVRLEAGPVAASVRRSEDSWAAQHPAVVTVSAAHRAHPADVLTHRLRRPRFPSVDRP